MSDPTIKDATVEELVMELQSRGLFVTISENKPREFFGSPSAFNVLKSIGKKRSN